MELRKVDSGNVWQILALQVQESQRKFVATNTESIVEAYCAITSGGVALPFGIYDGQTPVGFLMIGYGCLDWAPTYLKESAGYDIKQAGWAYFLYEFAAIPGTLVCGWLSDKVFKGRRAMPTIIFMAIVAVFIYLYWQFSANVTIVTISLIAIGFFIYGPVMLIGVQALDLAPKNAAGTAAGLTGFFGYFFGTAILANIVIGYVAENAGWDWTFVLLIAACLLSVVLMAMTNKEEKKLLAKK